MKPRLFIGSSTEGLGIAHAAQHNLYHRVEVTTWDQGVFKLSVSALDSLLEILKTCDFGMFVFSPDDIVTIRGNTVQTARDNVIFELGLFVGVLGRERCFILMPDDTPELHIPTDLIGMTPATFEKSRSDGSLQSATAPACHMIKSRIESVGLRKELIEAQQQGPKSQDVPDDEVLQSDSSTAALKESAKVDHPEAMEWLEAFASKEYEIAAELIAKQLDAATDDDQRAWLNSWLGSIKCAQDFANGILHLRSLTEKYPNNKYPYLNLINAYQERHLFTDALEIAEIGLQNASEKLALIYAKIHCLSEIGREEEVEKTLLHAVDEMPDTPGLYIYLADYYSDAGQADQSRSILETAERKLPNNELILSRYALELGKLSNKTLALVPYTHLIAINPEEPTYLANRANIFLDLDLKDLAMRDYKKANEISGGKEGWILANIGNLLKNQGFYREAIEYLHLSIDRENDSDYAHERLSTAIKQRDDEDRKFSKILKEARKELNALKLKKAEHQPGVAEIID